MGNIFIFCEKDFNAYLMGTLCKLLKVVIQEQKEKEKATTKEEFKKNLKGVFTIDTKCMGEMMFKTKIKDLLLSL